MRRKLTAKAGAEAASSASGRPAGVCDWHWNSGGKCFQVDPLCYLRLAVPSGRGAGHTAPPQATRQQRQQRSAGAGGVESAKPHTLPTKGDDRALPSNTVKLICSAQLRVFLL